MEGKRGCIQDDMPPPGPKRPCRKGGKDELQIGEELVTAPAEVHGFQWPEDAEETAKGPQLPFGEEGDNSPGFDQGRCYLPPPTCSPLPPSPGSPPPTPAQDQFLIREGTHRDAFLRFFSSGDSFVSVYAVGHKIGEGGFGKVFMARHRVLKVARAVKRLSKARGRSQSRKNELDAALALDHPHIVKLVEYYDEENYLYLIFELCQGPDLFDRIVKAPQGRLTEYDASVALRHMLKALQCCHSQYRGHFDIKPENFMYASEDLSDLKMIDMGMSSGFDLHRRRHKIKGTAAYMAPEFWRGIYGPEGDVWSCGVVLFVMLTGEPLLPTLSPATMKCESKVKSLLSRRLRYATTTFNLSADAQHLLDGMLQHDRHGRITIREALNHPFSSTSYDHERTNPHRLQQWPHKDAMRVLEKLPDTFRVVAAEPLLKRVARLAMAHFAEVSVPEGLAFRMLDWHGYGELSLSVLERDFHYRTIPAPEDLDQLFDGIDINRDGYISYLTFLSVTVPSDLRQSESLCRVVFDILDKGSKDGVIDAADLAGVFGDEEVCQRTLAEVSYEGRLTFPEFVQLMSAAV